MRRSKPQRVESRRLNTAVGLLLIIASFALTSCSLFSSEEDDWGVTKSPATGKPAAPPAETAVLYAGLKALYEGDLTKANATLLVVQETLPVSKRKSLTFPQDYAAVHRYLGEVNKACVASFLKANKQRYLLLPLAEPPPAIETVAIQRLNQLFHSGGWHHVQETYPHAQALISVARPGTCEDHEQALLYTMATRGDGGGEGVLTHLQKQSGVWQVVKKAVLSQADAL